MPVSKKRKKDGKPVHRKIAEPEHAGEHAHGPEGAPVPAAGSARLTGKATNPFVAQTRRASQRGR